MLHLSRFYKQNVVRNWLYSLLISVSGDIKLNPGPKRNVNSAPLEQYAI